METWFIAKRPFDPLSGESWHRYLAWSGLSQLRELVTLDDILAPTSPEELIAADWEYNVPLDYHVFYFRDLEYLLARTAGGARLNILAVQEEPTQASVESLALPEFDFEGFELLDIHGDISALTNCGGFPEAFAPAELSSVGLLQDLSRAYEVRELLREKYPREGHAQCHVWAIWRMLAENA